MERRRNRRSSTAWRWLGQLSQDPNETSYVIDTDTDEEEGEEDNTDEDSPYQGLQVVPAMRSEIEYSPPYYQSSPVNDDDIQYEADLQFIVDTAGVYDNDNERAAMADDVVEPGDGEEEAYQPDDIDHQIDLAYEGEGSFDFNNLQYNNPLYINVEEDSLNPSIFEDDTVMIYGDDMVAVGHEEEAEEDEVVIEASIDPSRHTMIFYQTDRWTVTIDSRCPALTDLLEERRFYQGLSGLWRVPFNVAWAMIAETGLGNNGWPYSVIHQTPVFTSDGFGPI